MLIKNIAINLFSQGYLLLLSFFTIPFILGKLGEEKYGILLLATALIGYFTTLDFGLGTALTKKISELRTGPRKKLDPYLGTAFLSFAFLALVFGLSLFAFAPFISGRILRLTGELNSLSLVVFRLTALNIGLYFLISYTDAIFQGFERFDFYNLKTFIVGTANTLGVAAVLWLGYGLREAVWLIFISLLVTFVLSLAIARYFFKINLRRPIFQKHRLKEMAAFGIFKFFGNVASQLNFHLPKFFIAYFSGLGEVSLFTVPFSLAQKTGILLSQISISIFPQTSHLKGRGEFGKIRSILFKGEAFVALVMAAFLAGGLVWGKTFLLWWLKDPVFVAKSLPIFYFLISAYFVRSFTAIPVAITEGLGNTKLPAVFVAINSFLTLSAGFFLIRWQGALGAAILIFAYTIAGVPLFLAFAYRFFKKEGRSGQEAVVVVSGLPRSGTSLAMQMLAKGGMPVLADRARKADRNNPRGYWELEKTKRLKNDSAWLKEAKGKAVKIVSPLLPHLPQKYFYKVVFLIRNKNEVLASQRQMLASQSKRVDPTAEKKLAAAFARHLKETRSWLSKQANIEVFYLDYNRLLANPRPIIKKLAAFLEGGLDRKLMAKAIDGKLYRQRGRQ